MKTSNPGLPIKKKTGFDLSKPVVFCGDPAGTRTPDLRLKRALLYQLSYWVIIKLAGWGGWTRTSECGSQSPVPYRLATPQYGRRGKGRSGRPGPQPQYGVGNGARNHDTRNHNPVLCQLSYTHRIQLKGAPAKPPFGFVGRGGATK